MKFKLVENYEQWELDEARMFVQDYLYDAIHELKNADLAAYDAWFEDKSIFLDDSNAFALEVAVKDAYIEAIDCGKIKRPKTMITSQLKDYIESNSNLLDNVDELMSNCPEHLRHELQLVLDVAELNESLTEASNAITKAFSDKIISGRTSNVRGSDIVSDALLDKYNMRKLSSNQHYVIHHRDGDHKNTSQGNEFIMSNTDHGRIHKLVRNRIQSQYFDSIEDHKILDYIAHLKQTQNLVTKLKNICSYAGIDEKNIIFEAPLLDDNDVVKRYHELIDSKSVLLKKINCEVFDEFFAKYQFLGSGKNNVRIAEYIRD